MTRMGYNMIVEGVLQEGGINFYAQKKGEAYANDEGYSLTADFINKHFKQGDGIVIQECIDVNHYYGIRIGVEYAEAFYMRETPGIIELGRLFV